MLVELIAPSWKKLLEEEFSSSYVNDLEIFLENERKEGKIIFPARENIFEALNKTPFDQVKVVILGQDPYHGEGQAHGMAFSVLDNVKIPPSLRNIYKELNSDLGVEAPGHGHLEKWAKQGVLLLNSVLTVEKSKAGSHQKKGWEKFTDAIIEKINLEKEHVVFFLWGSPAQKKGKRIDENKHLVLTAPHPSPLSSYRGFFGCKHFSKANKYLKCHKISTINWELAPSLQH